MLFRRGKGFLPRLARWALAQVLGRGTMLCHNDGGDSKDLACLVTWPHRLGFLLGGLFLCGFFGRGFFGGRFFCYFSSRFFDRLLWLSKGIRKIVRVLLRGSHAQNRHFKSSVC